MMRWTFEGSINLLFIISELSNQKDKFSLFQFHSSLFLNTYSNKLIQSPLIFLSVVAHLELIKKLVEEIQVHSGQGKDQE